MRSALLAGGLPRQCEDVDQAPWTLVQGLMQHGLFDETLVIGGRVAASLGSS